MAKKMANGEMVYAGRRDFQVRRRRRGFGGGDGSGSGSSGGGGETLRYEVVRIRATRRIEVLPIRVVTIAVVVSEAVGLG